MKAPKLTWKFDPRMGVFKIPLAPDPKRGISAELRSDGSGTYALIERHYSQRPGKNGRYKVLETFRVWKLLEE